MFLVAHGQDGNGLQLEQVAPSFSSCIVASQQNRLKIIMVYSPFENSLKIFSFMYARGAFCA